MNRALRNNTGKRRGSVLILSLIILTFLSVMALQLSQHRALKNRSVRFHKDKLLSFQIAKGALATIMENIERDRKNNGVDHMEEEWLRQYMKRDGEPETKQWRDAKGKSIGTYSVVISDESSKLNVNAAQLNELKILLKGLNTTNSEQLTRFIIGYRDGQKKKSKFYSVYELLTIPELKRDQFLGEDTNENGRLDPWEKDGKKTYPEDNSDSALDLGIKDYLTVVTDGKININAASLEVLKAMPGANPEIAKELVKLRDRGPIAQLDEIKESPLISDSVFAQIAEWASLKTDWYKVAISARAKDSKQSKHLVVLIDRSTQPAKIKYWRED